jgi:hypothetical protein
LKILHDKPWFAPKLFGVGASFPIAWQGWAVLAAFLLAMAANAAYLSGLVRVLVTLILVGALLLICAVKTDGGWRWRWGRR